jgi:hypothetical protein
VAIDRAVLLPAEFKKDEDDAKATGFSARRTGGESPGGGLGETYGADDEAGDEKRIRRKYGEAEGSDERDSARDHEGEGTDELRR